MFENLLRIACEEKKSNLMSREVRTTHVIDKKCVPDDPEIRIIEEKFGELIDGKVIEITLQDLLQLIPRSRRRTDAYRGLVKKCKDRGAILIITTNKRQGGEEK